MYIVVVEDARGALIAEQPLSDGPITFGRDEKNVVVLPNGTVSRRHAVISLNGNTPYVTDCGSSNGVLVDDELIKTPTVISEQSLVKIGDYRIYLEPANTGSSNVGMRTTILRPDQAHAKMVVVNGPEAGREIPLFDPICCIGRTDANDLTLSDVSISRQHARLKMVDDGAYILTDLGSSNGTWINGKRMKPESTSKVWHGDHIQFGNVDCLLLNPRGQASAHRPQSYWPLFLVALIIAIVFGIILSFLL